MITTIKFTLNSKVYARIYKENEKLFVECLFLYTHRHLTKKCKNIEEAIGIYNLATI